MNGTYEELMKRGIGILFLAFILLLTFSLASCTTSDDVSTDNQQIPQDQEKPLSQGSQLFLLEGNNCTEDTVGETSDFTPQQINMKEISGYKNDEARSLAIANVGAGLVLRIYDNPDGNLDDDWIEITTKTNIVAYCVNSFEQSFEDDLIRAVYQPIDGLDGKVSRFEVQSLDETIPLPVSTSQVSKIILPTDTTLPSLEPTSIPSRPTASVVNVIDGDTIDILIDGQVWRVRYIGIDSPESGQPNSDFAMNANLALVEGQTVSLEQDVSITDRFGRLLLYVYLADGTFVNSELVRLGAATAKAYPPDTRYQALFAEKQADAENAGVGIWSISTPLPTDTSTPTSTSMPTEVLPSTQIAVTNVVIQYIFFNGEEPQYEGDEYAEIKNKGSAGVNMLGWRLNAGDQGQNFYFPDIVIQPGKSCRVYTDEIHSEFCGLSYNNSQALWANSGECGYLYDSNGSQVSDYCY